MCVGVTHPVKERSQLSVLNIWEESAQVRL